MGGLLNYPRNPSAIRTVSIASGQAVSSGAPCSAARGLMVEIPAAWDAADIGFDLTIDGTTWMPLRNEIGQRVRIRGIVVSNLFVAGAELWALQAVAQVRLVSLNTASDANANQSAARTLRLFFLV